LPCRWADDRLFWPLFGLLVVLAAAPFWLTQLLPLQDYPQILVLARAWGDCRDPATPFFGTYQRSFPLSPLVLPILLLRALGALLGFETAGRVMWTLYAVALPLAGLHLLRVLQRDRWAVLLVFPLVLSYWVAGGFFAFATAAPTLVVSLAFAVRWFRSAAPRDGTALAVLGSALFLWHALAFAQLVLAFGILWTLFRHRDRPASARALLPILPPMALFATWFVSGVLRRGASSHPPTWPHGLDNAAHFFDYIGPVVPGATPVALLLSLLLAAGALLGARVAEEAGFRVKRPFVWVAVVTALLYFVLPESCFGVEGISNRQPWLAALLLVFAYPLPSRGPARVALIGAIGVASALVLASMGRSFAAFDEESAGASRLIDRLRPGQTLLAPVGTGSTPTFPSPAKPLIAVQLYATVRFGGLPDTSFAGYGTSIVRYVDGKDPMPGLRMQWRAHPDALRLYDYVLLRGDVPAAALSGLQPVASDGGWHLYGVCGSRSRPACT
jgi:hypothetical protein